MLGPSLRMEKKIRVHHWEPDTLPTALRGPINRGERSIERFFLYGHDSELLLNNKSWLRPVIRKSNASTC